MLIDVLDRIEQRLADLNITAGYASQKAGLSADAIRNMRRYAKQGKTNAGVNSNTISKLAPVLQTSTAWLLGETPDPSPNEGASGTSSNLGSAIRQARLQRGYTIAQVAESAGMSATYFSRLEAGDRSPSAIELEQLGAALQVRASALALGVVEQLDDEPLGNATFISDQMPLHSGPRDVEKLGVVAAGEEGDFEFNGAVAEYVQRPRGLVGRPGVFALELISDSMYPAYRKGDIVFCDKTAPEVGDDIVIETFPDEGAKVGKSFIKRLKRRSKSALVVEQFNPPVDLTFDPYAIKHLWRVVPNRELHGY